MKAVFNTATIQCLENYGGHRLIFSFLFFKANHTTLSIQPQSCLVSDAVQVGCCLNWIVDCEYQESTNI